MSTIGQTTGYSLWLVPEKEAQARLKSYITQFSEAHDLPLFDPHITLLPEVAGDERDILARTEQLSENVPSLEVKLTSVGSSDHFFQRLYLVADKTEPLVQANQLARGLFNRTNDLAYFPHLSMAYGSLYSADKEQAVAQLQRELVLPLNVQFDTLTLIHSEGRPSEWEPVWNFALKPTV